MLCLAHGRELYATAWCPLCMQALFALDHITPGQCLLPAVPSSPPLLPPTPSLPVGVCPLLALGSHSFTPTPSCTYALVRPPPVRQAAAALRAANAAIILDEEHGRGAQPQGRGPSLSPTRSRPASPGYYAVDTAKAAATATSPFPGPVTGSGTGTGVVGSNGTRAEGAWAGGLAVLGAPPGGGASGGGGERLQQELLLPPPPPAWPLAAASTGSSPGSGADSGSRGGMVTLADSMYMEAGEQLHDPQVRPMLF